MDEEDELLPALQRAADIDVRFLRYAVKRRLSGIYRNRGAYEKAKAVLWEAQNYVDDAVRLRDLQEGIEWMTWLSDRSR